jgi:hypothetical protein
MIKDDSNLIWEALISERITPDADTIEEEESPTSNLDNLISQATVEDNQSDIRRGPGTGATAAQFNAANATGYG